MIILPTLLHRASAPSPLTVKDRKSTMLPIMQLLVFMLLTFVSSSRPVFAHGHQSRFDGFPTDIISANTPTTATSNTNSASGSDNDGSRDSDTTSSLQPIGDQPLGIQIGGGFIVGCVIGALGYAAYRVTSGIRQARRRGRRGRAEGRTGMQEIIIDA